MSLRIAHFSDLHVTADPRRIAWRDLLSKRAVGWLNLRFGGRHAALADAPAVARALVRDLETLEAHHIVSTGDLTGLSLDEEFATAAAALAPLIGDRRVTGIPGNHDVYVPRAASERWYSRRFGSWERTDIDRDAAPEPLRAAWPYPLFRRVEGGGERAVIVALDDCVPAPFWDSSGRADPRQLEALRWLFARPEARDAVRFLALHYGLRRADGSPDTRHHRLRNAEDVLRLAAGLGVHVVLHGHLHGRFVHRAGAVAPFAIANPGALAYRGKARAYHVLEVARGAVSLAARRYDDAAGRFVPWDDAPGSGVIARV